MEENIVPKRNTPRDVFLHLLAMVTLYWSAISFTTLLWQYIDKWLPDTLKNNYGYFNDFSSYAIRFSVSALIIVFPVFIGVSWYLNKIYSKESYVRESKIRKWLIYLTLFIAALVIIGDLISVVNTLMSGDIPARFILKALSVLLVAGIIFWYYLDDVRRESPTKLAKPFVFMTGIMVLAVIVYAFFVVGSPSSTRLMQFDLQKVDDLRNLQNQIVHYWQSKENLPANLDDLKNSISGFKPPLDPQTSSPYDYRIVNMELLQFELCANFNKESNTANQPYRYGIYSEMDNWEHGAGIVCFERTIDRQLYPPFNINK